MANFNPLMPNLGSNRNMDFMNEPKTETDKKAELANALYESATKMQRDAQALLDEIKRTNNSEMNSSVKPMEEKPSLEPTPMLRPMTQPAAQAANNALIGNPMMRR